MGTIGYRFIDGVNPGPRYPKIGKKQTVANAARRNAILVAFVMGQAVGIILTFVAGVR